jgi:multiple sugar transport system permease protein
MAAATLPPTTSEGLAAVRGEALRVRPSRAGYGFVALYVVLLVLFGLVPTGYAIVQAFGNTSGGFAGLSNFTNAASDFRFVPALEHIGLYLLIWLVSLVVLVVGLALLLHQRATRTSSALRFVYYLPGALAGAASVLVWLFMLDPSVSPAAPLLRALGEDNFRQVIDPGHLPLLFAVIAFWTGAGGWIVIIHGALNNIPDELIQAAEMDGASRWQIARLIQIPMLKKWIVYMAILAFAAGTQLFVEPQLVAQASLGAVSDSWSPNQLAYQFAFNYGDFGYAAAIAVYLLIIGLACATVLVFRSGLFDEE